VFRIRERDGRLARDATHKEDAMTYRFQVVWERAMEHSKRRKRETWEVEDAVDDYDAMHAVVEAAREDVPWWSDGRFTVHRLGV
jgi:hypothetical protein